MQQNLFPQMFDVSGMLPPPLTKTNKLIVTELEKVVNFQMGVLRYYVDTVLNQMKAAAEITDAKGLQDLVQRQTEVATVVRQRMMDDVKVLTEMGNSFKADFDTLAKENVTELTPELPKVIKKAA